MYIVFSGPLVPSYLRKDLESKYIKNILHTYFRKKEMLADINKHWVNKDVSLWVDCGAFSQWNTAPDADIDPVVYGEWCKEFYQNYKNKFKQIYFISLDKIPGRPGVKPTQKQREQSAQISYDNYIVLKNLGVPNLLPTVHQHEDVQWVKEYEKHTDYICISPANDETNVGRSKWLDQVWSVINPTTKTHGLAVTGFTLLARYPFYSADSITWKVSGLYGIVQGFDHLKTYQLRRYRSRKESHLLDSLDDLRDFKMYEIEVDTTDNDQKKMPYNVDYFQLLETYVTEIWAARGVVWNS